MGREGEERLDEAGQQPETLDDDTGLAGKSEEIFGDQAEALALKPGESLKHRFRRSLDPALVHVHGHEPVQQRGVCGRRPMGVIRHHGVGRVDTQTVLSGNAPSDGGFACTASAAEPMDVAEEFRTC